MQCFEGFIEYAARKSPANVSLELLVEFGVNGCLKVVHFSL